MYCVFSLFGLVQPAVVYLDLVFLLGRVVGLFLVWFGRASFVYYDVWAVVKIQFAEVERFLSSLSYWLRCNFFNLVAFWFEIESFFKAIKRNFLRQS